MGISIGSRVTTDYTTVKNEIKKSDKKTGILEVRSSSEAKKTIKLQLTYVGHREKVISIPLQKRAPTDASDKSPSTPVGLRFKTRRDLEKMLVHPNLLNSTLHHIASLNLQASTHFEDLSLQQLQDIDALIRICHDKHTPKLLKNAIFEQILSKIEPQTLLKNPQLLCQTVKTMSALLNPQESTEPPKLSSEKPKTVNVETAPNPKKPIKPENLSSEKLQNLTELLGTYNDPQTPESVKQAISNQVFSKIEPQKLIKHPKLLQETLQLMSSLNLQTFVRGNLNALKNDLDSADLDSLTKHSKELNTPEAQKNSEHLDRLIKIFKDPKMPQAQKDLIQSFFQHPETGITRQERKEFEKLQKDLPILLKRYPKQLKETLELQKTVRQATDDIERMNYKDNPPEINRQKIKDIGKILEIAEPPSPKDMSTIAKLASNSIDIPSDAATGNLQLSDKTKKARSAYIQAMMKYKAMAQEEIKNAKGGHKKLNPEVLMEAYNTATTAYKSAIATYDDEVKALESDKERGNKTLFEARNAMDKLSKIAFDKNTPSELSNLIKRDFIQSCKQVNVPIMNVTCGVPESVISKLTMKGAPMVENKPDEEELRREAMKCGIKTECYHLKEYNGIYVVRKDGEHEAMRIEQSENDVQTYRNNTIRLTDEIKRGIGVKSEKELELEKYQELLKTEESKLEGLRAKEERFETREAALEVIAKNHQKNKDVSPTSDGGHYLFYEIRAEKGEKNSSYAKDQLLYYNTLPIETRPVEELHTDQLLQQLQYCSTQLLDPKTEPETRKMLAGRIDTLVKNAQNRMYALPKFANTILILSGFDDKEKLLQPHTGGLFQNGPRVDLLMKELPKYISMGNAALEQYNESLKPSSKDSDTSATKDIVSGQGALEKDEKNLKTAETQNSTETVSA